MGVLGIIPKTMFTPIKGNKFSYAVADISDVYT